MIFRRRQVRRDYRAGLKESATIDDDRCLLKVSRTQIRSRLLEMKPVIIYMHRNGGLGQAKAPPRDIEPRRQSGNKTRNADIVDVGKD